MARERTCIACKTKYNYCPTCSRSDALKPSWYSEFCSESCMTLWTTLTKYNMELVTKEEAQDIITALDLKPINTYVPCVQRDYAKVTFVEKKPKKLNLKKIDATPVPVEPVEPVVAQPTVHEVVIENNKEL